MSGKPVQDDDLLNPPLDDIYSNTTNQKGFGIWNASSEGGYDSFYEQDTTVGGTLHDEILSIVHNTGLDALAAETGILQNGEIPAIKDYRHEPLAKQEDARTPLKRSAPESRTTAPPAPSSSAYASGVSPSSSSKKRRADRKNAADKNGKGLRHFSMKVCSKVEEKKTTSYNEVADDLVAELQAAKANGLDQKNIRRRVYDALNVLMAMGIISKQRKEIKWVGLPYARGNRQELTQLELEKAERQERTKRKEDHVKELLALHNAYRNLIARNRRREQAGISDAEGIHVPFLLVKTQAHTIVNCEMVEDRTAYYFDFNLPFEIHDDNSLLQAMSIPPPPPPPPPPAAAAAAAPSATAVVTPAAAPI